jgi:hypothetical protein
MTDKSTLTFTLYLRDKKVGTHLGGTQGQVVACPKCGYASCKLNQKRVKGRQVDQYGHAVTCSSTPISQSVEWTDICEVAT